MALTAIQVKNAKAIGKPLKLSDGGGLFLFVQVNGSKYWRLAYRFQGKQKTLALGVYPAISLSDVNADLKLTHYCSERRFKIDTPPLNLETT